METPKHLIAMAASKNTAARGNVNSATAKNEARLCGALAAQRESKYRPNAATPPENRHVIIPGMIPTDAKAYADESMLMLDAIHLNDLPEET